MSQAHEYRPRRMSGLKDLAQAALQKTGYRIAYAPNDRINGLSFIDDVRLVVNMDDPVCFDVGANEGQTVELLQKTFRQPRIFAFEPAEETFRRLRTNVQESNVALFNCALGRERSEQEFLNYEDSCLSSFLPLSEEQTEFQGVRIKSRQVVEIHTVDSFVAEHELDRIDLLKIDTQGYDLEVLMGASGSFKAGLIRSVFVELNFVPLYQSQSDANRISEFLLQQNLYLVDYYEKVRSGHTIEWCTALFARNGAE